MELKFLVEDINNSELLNNYLAVQNSLETYIKNALNTNSNIKTEIVLPPYEYILRSFPMSVGDINLLSVKPNSNNELIIDSTTFRNYLINAVLSQSNNGMSVNRINLSPVDVYENEKKYNEAITDDARKTAITKTVRKNSTLFVAMIKISSLGNNMTVIYDPIVKHYDQVKGIKVSPNHVHSLCININGFKPIKYHVKYQKINNRITATITDDINDKLINVLHTALKDEQEESFKLMFDRDSSVIIANLIYTAFVKGLKYKDDNNNIDVSIFYPNVDNCKYIIEPVNLEDPNTDFKIRLRKTNESYTNTEGLEDITYQKLFKFC